MEKPWAVLLATCSPSEHIGLVEALSKAAGARITIVGQLNEAADLLLSGRFNCAFAETDEKPGDWIRNLHGSGLRTPVVAMLPASASATHAEQAVRAGFQDALVPGEATQGRLLAILSAAALISRAEQRATAAETRRAHLTLYHPVTGLPQAPLFYDRLDQGLEMARRQSDNAAVAVVGLDDWQSTVRRYGTKIADAASRAVSARLRTLARRSDTIAHLSDDVFAVLLAPGRDGGAEVAAARMVDAAQSPILLAGESLRVSASAGCALFPDDGETGATLLRRADLAMRLARHSGAKPGRFSGKQPDPAEPVPVHCLPAEIDYAIREGQFELVFQPKVGVTRVEFEGVEALVRWHHPRHGILHPDAFIPAAEQTGSVTALTAHVLEQALTYQNNWRTAGRHIPIAVNLSAVSLQIQDFPDAVASALERHGTRPGDLTMEITETAIVSDLDRAAQTLEALNAQGIRIAIDDFGAGFTSLSHLGRLPVEELKLDGSFSRRLTRNKDEHVILRSIIGLGRSLGLRVVAEGVESAAVWHELVSMECHTAQGYFVSRPLRPGDLMEWIQNSAWTNLPASAMATT